jgi:NAD(P)-dependent dehydrogenase (short-subunit alcohol dehydrogenase family)
MIRSKISSSGSLIAHPLEVSDLSSVKAFASWYNEHYSQQLDILITNAGINYRSNNLKPSPDTPLVSPQGYDLAFATNYLGHFLLAELLLPSLLSTPNSRLVLVSSGANYLVNGSSLLPDPTPKAAQVPHHLDTAHWEEAYPNSKLAQVLHMFALQDRVNELPIPFTETPTQRRLQVSVLLLSVSVCLCLSLSVSVCLSVSLSSDLSLSLF